LTFHKNCLFLCNIVNYGNNNNLNNISVTVIPEVHNKKNRNDNLWYEPIDIFRNSNLRTIVKIPVNCVILFNHPSPRQDWKVLSPDCGGKFRLRIMGGSPVLGVLGYSQSMNQIPPEHGPNTSRAWTGYPQDIDRIPPGAWTFQSMRNTMYSEILENHLSVPENGVNNSDNGNIQNLNP